MYIYIYILDLLVHKSTHESAYSWTRKTKSVSHVLHVLHTLSKQIRPKSTYEWTRKTNDKLIVLPQNLSIMWLAMGRLRKLAP